MTHTNFSNTIICGDAAKTLKALPSEFVDMVVTDPPYLVNYRDRTGRRVANDDNAQAVARVFQEIGRVMKPDSYCLSFYGWNGLYDFAEMWRACRLRPVGHFVWHKAYASKRAFAEYRHESAFLLAKGRPSLPSNPIPDVQPWTYSGNKAHPTEKSVSVIEPLIRSYSKTGDLILDPFLGSGTTAVAAAKSGRRFIGMELEREYCEHAMRRLNKLCHLGSAAA